MEVTKENFPNLTKKQREARQALEDAAEARRAKMREMPERRCLECKQFFKPKKSWQKFCSSQHRMKNWNDANLPKEVDNEQEESKKADTTVKNL